MTAWINGATTSPRPINPRRQIATAIGAHSNAEAIGALRALSGRADLAELRLDLLREPPDLEALLVGPRVPVIATNRPRREGGCCKAPEPERLALLLRAAELGAEYVDLESDAFGEADTAAIRAAGARLIVSRHDVVGMPDLVAWAEQIAALAPDVVKVVGLALEARDVLVPLRVLARAHLPTIAIAMGEAGLASRVLALRDDACFLTFAAPDGVAGTAPGQITLAEMLGTYRARSIGPATRVYGIRATPATPELVARHNATLAARGEDAVAVPLPLPLSDRDAATLFAELPVVGWLDD